MHGTRYLTARNAGLARFIAEDLRYLDFEQTLEFYRDFNSRGPGPQDIALLACNDRYFLLVGVLKRRDALNPWLFARCREVEANPDEHIDLWARYHYKSTLITFAGSIQEITRNPEITICIFSHTRDIARKFLRQIKQELESNSILQSSFPDVFYLKPRSEAPKWSETEGLVVKRKSNPKEATVEAWGLVDGQPTAAHFALLVYDDVVTKKNVTNPEMVTKTTESWELSDNLGIGEATRKWHVGTRYSFSDTYAEIISRKILKPRLYPATENGRADGKPVFLSQKMWNRIKVTQRSTLSAQMLQNPAQGQDAMFRMAWLKQYEVRPGTLNVYIMGDPSKGRSATSDNTALSVVGVDASSNKYLLDGVRHRMSLKQRWENLRDLHKKWSEEPGVVNVAVGYEQYGQVTDIEYFNERMEIEKYWFGIAELAWPKDGTQSKEDRVQRLQPDFETGKFLLPAVVWHETLDARRNTVGAAWKVDADKGLMEFTPLEGPTKLMRVMVHQNQPFRCARQIKRMDNEGNVYDLTRALIEEFQHFPFSQKKDLIDATSRIYDMKPLPPVMAENVIINTPAFADA